MIDYLLIRSQHGFGETTKSNIKTSHGLYKLIDVNK